VHLRVEERLCRLKNRGTSGNSCKKNTFIENIDLDHIYKYTNRLCILLKNRPYRKTHTSDIVFNIADMCS
jgi:hypothetical protein